MKTHEWIVDDNKQLILKRIAPDPVFTKDDIKAALQEINHSRLTRLSPTTLEIIVTVLSRELCK